MTLRRWCLAWVLFALVCAQALGFMHRVAHGPQAALPALHGPAAQAQQESPAPAPAGWIEALFAGHGDESGCRLFDAVAPDVLPLPAALAVLSLPVAVGALHWASAVLPRRCAAPFQARGPPPGR